MSRIGPLENHRNPMAKPAFTMQLGDAVLPCFTKHVPRADFSRENQAEALMSRVLRKNSRYRISTDHLEWLVEMVVNHPARIHPDTVVDRG